VETANDELMNSYQSLRAQNDALRAEVREKGTSPPVFFLFVNDRTKWKKKINTMPSYRSGGIVY
jgi:SMC interacting uncharacterized protein involved in chromosome segregation